MNAARLVSTTNPRPSKGEETRALILQAALRQASTEGYEALTIGTLAEKTGMSKSGLFAHFGSKEELQIATLDYAVRKFSEAAVLPAMSAPRGLRRLNAMFESWVTWTARTELAGCPIMTAMAEFDDRPGPLRDAVVEHMKRLHDSLVKSVQMTKDTGEFDARVDPEQVAFELFGILASCYRSRHLFHDARANDRARVAYARLVAQAKAPAAN